MNKAVCEAPSIFVISLQLIFMVINEAPTEMHPVAWEFKLELMIVQDVT